MKLSLAAALAAIALTLPAGAQSPATCNSATIPVCSPGSPSGEVQIQPQSVPTSTTTVATSDAYLEQITITNTTAAAVTFTLSDRQATPVSLLSAVSIAANSTYVISFPNRYWCPSGFTVVAGGSGLKFYGKWVQ